MPPADDLLAPGGEDSREAAAPPAGPIRPPSHMGLAVAGVIVGLFSLIGVLFGLCAIIAASRVRRRWQDGDIAGAGTASSAARHLGILAIVLGAAGIEFALWVNFIGYPAAVQG